MNRIKRGAQRLLPRLTAILLRTSRAVVSFVSELNYAQRRSMELFLSRDGYLVGPVTPVRSYGEFLTRTSGPLVHEPSAEARLTGQPVR